jgi:hypothetical protein
MLRRAETEGRVEIIIWTCEVEEEGRLSRSRNEGNAKIGVQKSGTGGKVVISNLTIEKLDRLRSTYRFWSKISN